MKAQVGDLIRINQDNANLAFGVKRGDVFEVDHVWENDQYDRVTVKAREDRNNREWMFSQENYEIIAHAAHAAKPETSEACETFTEIAKRLCEFRNCNTCPVGAGSSSCCAVYAARFIDVDTQIRAARAWAAENPPTPKPGTACLRCARCTPCRKAQRCGERNESIPCFRAKHSRGKRT